MSATVTDPELPNRVLQELRAHDGRSFAEISAAAPVLLIFLRHSGCPFCRQTLADIQAVQPELQARGIEAVFVHMGTEDEIRPLFESYGLSSAARFSDTHQSLYDAFGLKRGSYRELFGPRVWKRGWQAAVTERLGMGPLIGDATQMPGVFLIDNGRIINGYTYITSADRPDYLGLVDDAYMASGIHAA